MEFKKLTPEMLEFRLGADPEIDPEWFIAHLKDIIRFNPDGCFALVDDDSVIGMITSTAYQHTGWLGWLFVLERYRHHGLGEKLMRRAMDHLQSEGMETILLEADTKAVSLYRRLGFVEQFHTRHFTLAEDDFESVTVGPVEVRPAKTSDLPSVAAFDREYFHEDRRALFEIVFGNPNFRGFVAQFNGSIVGYLFITEATDNQQVSPMVVDLSHESSVSAERALISAAFGACAKPLYFRLPMLTEGYSDRLRSLGARPIDYRTVRMYLGREYKPEREGVLSLGCPGKG